MRLHTPSDAEVQGELEVRFPEDGSSLFIDGAATIDWFDPQGQEISYTEVPVDGAWVHVQSRQAKIRWGDV